MADITRRIPLWIIGTVTGISVIGLIGFLLWFIFWIGFVPVICSNEMN